ncbi:hypothetical protein TIFTF001_000849 [Ficus carica]|uniref:Uncharacterized protein n=1 Tax=Ficus carica TaxID=3494 RepID=A0AA88D2M6_FICCA|nr:hypothetical protein TIFTF001_000849 [Ficus carica]
MEAAGSRGVGPVMAGSRGEGLAEIVYTRKVWAHSRLATEIWLWCIMGDKDRVVGRSWERIMVGALPQIKANGLTCC